MLENSKAAHRNFTYIPYSIYPTPLHQAPLAISKPLKPNPTGVHLLGSGQDTRAYLPMGLTTPCMLENSQAAHLNFAHISQPDGGILGMGRTPGPTYPWGSPLPCMLENSQAAHLNFGPTTSPFLSPKSPTRRGYTY